MKKFFGWLLLGVALVASLAWLATNSDGGMNFAIQLEDGQLAIALVAIASFVAVALGLLHGGDQNRHN